MTIPLSEGDNSYEWSSELNVTVPKIGQCLNRRSSVDSNYTFQHCFFSSIEHNTAGGLFKG